MPKKSYDTAHRLFSLAHFIISSPTGRTFDEIKEEFRSVSARTLYRHLDAIVTEFPIVKERVDNTIIWKSINPKIKIDVMFNLEELNALKIAQKLISSQFQGTTFQKGIDSLFEKIDKTLPPKQRNMLEQLGDCYGVLPYGVKDYSGSAKFFQDIIDAITWLKRLKIKYKPANTKTLQEYQFEPYNLVNAKGGFYLIGYERGLKEIRTLAVERIQSLEIIGPRHAYDIPEDFSIQKYFEGAFGVIASTPVDVKIKFDAILEEYLRERKWAGCLGLKKENKHIVMHLKVGITRELISWILSFGERAEVQEPEELRKKVKEDLEKTLEKYR